MLNTNFQEPRKFNEVIDEQELPRTPILPFFFLGGVSKDSVRILFCFFGLLTKESLRIVFSFFFKSYAFFQSPAVEMSLAVLCKWKPVISSTRTTQPQHHLKRFYPSGTGLPAGHWSLPSMSFLGGTYCISKRTHPTAQDSPVSSSISRCL